MSTSPERRRRMQSILSRLQDLSRERRQRHSSYGTELNLPTSSSRRIASPGAWFRQRQQDRSERLSRLGRELTGSANNSMAQLQEAGERLAQVNEDLRNLLERPLHSTGAGARQSGPGEGSPEDGTNNHGRRKRRRINGDEGPKSEMPVINYGYYGQVVPGRLTMQLVSSDGGIMEPDTGHYGAENVLRDDASVYCTKSSRCNMVLCHQGETTFCLERLVIKAPKTGFSHPVQEGLVFVAMERGKIFERTAQYQIHYYPASHFASMTGPNRSNRPVPLDNRTLSPPLVPQRGRELERLRVAARRTLASASQPAGNSNPTDAADCWDSEEEDADRQDSQMQHWLTPGLAFESPMDESSGSSSGDGDDDEDDPDETEARNDSSTNTHLRVPQTQDRAPRPAGRFHARRREEYDFARYRLPRLSRSPSTAAMALAVDEAAAPIWAQTSHRASRRHRSPMFSEFQDMLEQFDFDEVLRRGDNAAADRRARRLAMQVRADQMARQRERSGLDVAGEETAQEEAARMQRERSERSWARAHRAETPASMSSDRHEPRPAPSASTFELLGPAARFSMSSRSAATGAGADSHDSGSDNDKLDPDTDAPYQSSTDPAPTHRPAGTHRPRPTQTQQIIRTATSRGSKMTVRFDPPLSARYVLVKLWNPKHGGNIDVQSIAAYGYAGGRFIAKVEMR